MKKSHFSGGLTLGHLISGNSQEDALMNEVLHPDLIGALYEGDSDDEDDDDLLRGYLSNEAPLSPMERMLLNVSGDLTLGDMEYGMLVGSAQAKDLPKNSDKRKLLAQTLKGTNSLAGKSMSMFLPDNQVPLQANPLSLFKGDLLQDMINRYMSTYQRLGQVTIQNGPGTVISALAAPFIMVYHSLSVLNKDNAPVTLTLFHNNEQGIEQTGTLIAPTPRRWASFMKNREKQTLTVMFPVVADAGVLNPVISIANAAVPQPNTGTNSMSLTIGGPAALTTTVIIPGQDTPISDTFLFALGVQRQRKFRNVIGDLSLNMKSDFK